MPVFDRHFWLVALSGGLLGLLGVLLAVWGNPENSGICVSCFVENSAGAIGLHANERMQYLRPELIGFLFGSVASSRLLGEFRSRSGRAMMPRFLSGVFLIVGCAVFIGCPIKLFLRLTAGDLTALTGLAGLVVGVWLGIKAHAAGINFGRSKTEPGASGIWLPAIFLLMLIFVFLEPGFVRFSETGSASQHAPVLISLAAGLLLGFLAQRSRFCITASIRDLFLMGIRAPLAWGLLAFVVVAIGASAASGGFNYGYYGQPGSHHDILWSFLGMVLVGWLSVIIGGCPFRQLIKAGEGDGDAAMVVLGMLVGGGLVQSWGIAATAAGVSSYGKIAVLVGLIFVLLSTLLYRERSLPEGEC